MKLKQHLRKIYLLSALTLAAAAPQGKAFTYTDGDLLLVFRKDTFNDMEFNLGTVSNFLGKVNGTVINVTNFSLPQLTANFGGSLSGVNVSVVAVTSTADALLRAFVTDQDSANTPVDITGSKFSTIWSKVNGVGTRGAQATGNTSTNAYSVSSSDSSAYTYLASNGGLNPEQIGTLAGTVAFPVDNVPACTLRFFQLKVSAITPKPNSTQIGSFSVTTGGAVTFTAGSGVTAPTIASNPTNVTVFAGGTAGFTVAANGSAPLSYQWYFGTTLLSGANNTNYSLTAHSTNAGGYTVIVSNSGGSATSTVATLTVNLPAAAQLGSFGKAAGGPFQFRLTGTASAYYEIQVSTNLSITNWTTIALITNGGGATTYSDSASTNLPNRFYRAIAR